MDTPEGESEPGKPNLVRPYTLTAGRTDSSVNLPLEAPVETLNSTRGHRWQPNDVRSEIVKLCVNSPSVAEVAAQLSLPLGVARVLIGDLVSSGYLRVHATLGDRSTVDERREMIGRTLRGLRAL